MPALTTQEQEIATHLHADCMGTALKAGDLVSVFDGPLLRVERLHGRGLFVFIDAAGQERTQFCCVATLVTPAPFKKSASVDSFRIKGQSGAGMLHLFASALHQRAAHAPAHGKRSAGAGEGAEALPVLTTAPLGNHGEINHRAPA